MPLTNATKYAVAEIAQYDHLGVEVLLVLVKATFDLQPNGRTVPSSDPEPVIFQDELNGEDEWSSVARPTDAVGAKPGADVIVLGSAIPPRPAVVHDVAVRVDGVARPLRVHGTRLFESGAFGALSIGPAMPYEEMPIVYEKAYGGHASDWSDMEMRNPAGIGVCKSVKELEGEPAPQIEHPDRAHRSSRDRHPPMGYGAIAHHWEPRRTHFGNMEDRDYRTVRMPLFPRDFDLRFNAQAHPTLRLERYFQKDEQIHFLGMSNPQLVTFTIPNHGTTMRAIFDDRRLAVDVPWDTMVAEPAAMRFTLSGRASFPLGRVRGTLLREVQIDPAGRAPPVHTVASAHPRAPSEAPVVGAAVRKPSSSMQPVTAPEPAADAPAPASSASFANSVGLSLLEYSMLSAELEIMPEHAERAFAKYGLTDPARRQEVDAAWRARLASVPEDMAEYGRLRERAIRHWKLFNKK